MGAYVVLGSNLKFQIFKQIFVWCNLKASRRFAPNLCQDFLIPNSSTWPSSTTLLFLTCWSLLTFCFLRAWIPSKTARTAPRRIAAALGPRAIWRIAARSKTTQTPCCRHSSDPPPASDERLSTTLCRTTFSTLRPCTFRATDDRLLFAHNRVMPCEFLSCSLLCGEKLCSIHSTVCSKSVCVSREKGNSHYNWSLLFKVNYGCRRQRTGKQVSW